VGFFMPIFNYGTNKLAIELTSRLPPTEKKIALIDWWQYHLDSTVPNLAPMDLVICITAELVHEPWDIFYNKTQTILNNKNSIFVVGGIFNNILEPDTDRLFYPYLQFLHYVADNSLLDYSNQLRPYLFDVLLGQNKDHRRYVFNRLSADHLLDNSIVSLSTGPYSTSYCHRTDGYYRPCDDYESACLPLLEEDFIIKFKQKATTPDQRYSANVIKHNNNYMPMSCYIPYKIYQNSWYSIVCETNNETSKFITEKTGKPLFAKRLFVCFNQHGHLEFLRSQGFKTFDRVIDESYDLEPNIDKRFDMAFEQVRWLAKQNPEIIYSQIQDILEHNQQTILNCKKKNYSAIVNFISNWY
jgi:hypothetical protein